MATGTYYYKLAWKSEPRPCEYYLDTFQTLRFVITAGAGQSTPSTTISGNAAPCSGSNFSLSHNGNTSAATGQWFRNNIAIGAGTGQALTQNLPAGSYSYTFIADLATTTGCWTKAYDTSAPFIVTVTQAVTPSISISVSPDSVICATSPLTFTAAISNGGTSPAYLWKHNSIPVGGNSPVYSPVAAANGDQITCSLTSNATCAIAQNAQSNIITMLVTTPATAPPITISGTTQVVGVLQSIYTAAVPPGISNYSIDWYNRLGGMWVHQATVNSNNSWMHNVPGGLSDTVRAVLKPGAGCYSPDSSVSNILVLPVSTGIGNASMPSGFYLYPNPATQSITIEGMRSGDEALLRDALGKTVAHLTAKGLAKEVWTLPTVASGIYFVECSRADGSERWRVKLVKQ